MTWALRAGRVVARAAGGAVAVAIAALALGPLAGGAAAQERALSDPGPRAAAEAVRGLVAAAAQDVEDLAQRVEGAPTPRPTLAEDEAIAIAETSGRLDDWISDHPVARTAGEFEADEERWLVSFISTDGDGEETVEAQVFVDDARGEITEVRTGPQVAWMMARGYDGAFGRAINREAIWLTLCALFLVPLLRPRSLVSWRTLDLLVLLSFSLSLIWFNRGEIFTSVPLAYPPLIYLGARLAWIGLRRTPGRAETAAPAPPLLPRLRSWAPTWLLVTLLTVTLGLRYGLNAFDANVIDVGYAGVIGADRIAGGQTPYGTFPADCGACDTYGPATYLAYVPFEQLQPWSGTWDSLPAAHGAATAFDALAIAGLVVLGASLASWRLGLGLGLAFAAFPFTGYALETNSNDTLVAAALIWGLVLVRRPLGRGLMLGLATAAKFGPAILLLLWSRRPFPAGRDAVAGRLARYGGGLAAAAALTGWVLFLDGTDGARAFWSRTLGYQIGRDSPFSIWGQHPGLRPVQIGLMVLVALAAVAVLARPRRLDVLRLTALSGALMIGLQLTMTHWFYLYIPWFLPFALVALLPDWSPAGAARPAPPVAAASGARPEPALRA